MNRLVRGLTWGVICSVAACAAILAVVPVLNKYVVMAMAAATVVSMAVGLALNAGARRVSCLCGHTFLATSRSSRCPTCGRRAGEIADPQGGATP